MRSDIKVIAWDFDGVLNRNIIDGRFVWADRLEEDLGIPVEPFTKSIFTPTFLDVINGRIDLHDHVGDWLQSAGHPVSAEDLLTYWFEKDDLPDRDLPGLVAKIGSIGVHQVIATNNETHRVAYIERTSLYLDHIGKVYSSGRIGHAKPSSRFFDHVREDLQLAPADLLLIDDSLTNVEAAKALGWDAFHFTSENRHLLPAYLRL